MTKPAIGAGLLLVGFFAAGLVIHGQDRPFLWNVVETGIRRTDAGAISIQFAENGHVQVQFRSADERITTIEAAGFSTSADATGMTVVAVGPAYVQFAPAPRLPDVVGPGQYRLPFIAPEIKLRLPRDGPGMFYWRAPR